MSTDEPKVSPYDRFQKLIQEGALYAKTEFTANDLHLIAGVLNEGGLRVDLDCPSCGSGSTFVLNPLGIKGIPTRPATIAALQELPTSCRWLELYCSRKPVHRAIFNINLVLTGRTSGEGAARSGNVIWECTKIGQFPSHRDLVAGRLREVQSIIKDRIDLLELRSAAGFFSHDAAVGAFTYLRRVFQRQIERMWAQASNDGKQLPDRRQTPMKERMKALRGYLPDEVIDSPQIWGILSAGIHELSEEQCRKMFPVLEAATLMMLQRIKEKADRDNLSATLARELSSFHEEIIGDDSREEPTA